MSCAIASSLARLGLMRSSPPPPVENCMEAVLDLRGLSTLSVSSVQAESP